MVVLGVKLLKVDEIVLATGYCLLTTDDAIGIE